MIYQGVKPECFYWEFINIFRKVFLVSLNVFMGLFPNYFKALLALLVLSVFSRLQIRIKPYKSERINILEQNEYMTTVITFFGSLFFLSDENPEYIKTFVLILLLLINARFILIWVSCLLTTMKIPVF
jgi:hypothetical protein